MVPERGRGERLSSTRNLQVGDAGPERPSLYSESFETPFGGEGGARDFWPIKT